MERRLSQGDDDVSDTKNPRTSNTGHRASSSPHDNSSPKSNSLPVINTSSSVKKPLSSDELMKMYKLMLKLSAENKINAKNAFDLQLIDYMSDVLREQNNSVEFNFQNAGLTIDASGKIYAHRVDALHMTTYKVLGEVHVGLGRKGIDPEENAAPTQEQQVPVQKSVKKRLKKGSQIIDCETKIKQKTENSGFCEVDHFLNLRPSDNGFDDGGGLLCADIATLSDNNLNIFTGNNLEKPLLYRDTVDVISLPPISNIRASVVSSSISSSLANFYETVDDDTIRDQNNFTHDSFSNTPIHDHSMEDNHPATESGEESSLLDRNAIDRLINFIDKQPGDYSYFDANKVKLYAGSKYWNFGFHNNEEKANKRMLEICKSKKSKKRKIDKKSCYIDYYNDENIADFFVSLKSSNKKCRTLKTGRHGCAQLIDVPPACASGEFAYMFWRRLANDKVFQKACLISDKYQSAKETNTDDDNYNPCRSDDLVSHDNNNDISDRAADTDVDNFQPTVRPTHSTGFSSQGSSTFQMEINPSSQFSPENLVPAPAKAPKVEITYAKVAKKINMQLLKSQMKKAIDTTAPFHVQIADRHIPSAESHDAKCISLSSVYDKMLNGESNRVREELSPALAFFSLLQLANENNYVLKEGPNHSDIFIVHKCK